MGRKLEEKSKFENISENYHVSRELWNFVFFMVYISIFFKIYEWSIKTHFKLIVWPNKDQKRVAHPTYKLDTSSILGLIEKDNISRWHLLLQLKFIFLLIYFQLPNVEGKTN